MHKKLNIGALISGGGTNLQAIIDACASGTLNAKICFVGSDNPDAAGLERARRAEIDTFVVNYKDIIRQFRSSPDEFILPRDFNLDEIKKKQKLMCETTEEKALASFFKTRAASEKQLLDKISPYDIDLLVLAGFMRTLTPYFIDRFNLPTGVQKIMNIHPALLPAFPGTDGYGDTFRYGCKVGGCTVHFIDYGEDTGQIIGQRAFSIEDTDTLESVKKKGLALEWELYPACIQWFADNISGNHES